MGRYRDRPREMIDWARANFDDLLTLREQTILAVSADHDLEEFPEPKEENTAPGPEFVRLADDDELTVGGKTRRLVCDVRPQFVRWLVTDPGVAERADPRGFIISSALFLDGLILENCTIALPLTFNRCRFLSNDPKEPSALGMKGTSLAALKIYSCDCDKINFNGMRASGAVEISSSRIFTLQALECHIMGSLRLLEVCLVGRDPAPGVAGAAATFVRSRIDGTVTLTSMVAKCVVSFLGCGLGGVEIAESEFHGDGNSLAIMMCAISGDVTLSMISSSSKAALADAYAEPGQPAAPIEAPKPTSGGGLSLIGTRIGGHLRLDRFSFTGTAFAGMDAVLGPEHCSIDMRGIRVSGETSFGIGKDTWYARHGIHAYGAEFNGNVVFVGGTIGDGGKIVLDSAKLGKKLMFLDLKVPLEHIRLVGASVSNDVTLRNVRAGALIATRLQAGTLSFSDATFTWGCNLQQAKVGYLLVEGAQQSSMLLAAGLHVDSFGVLGGIAPPEQGKREEDAAAFARRWVRWLSSQPIADLCAPEAWLCLANALDNRGDREQARWVRYVFRRHQAQASGSVVKKFSGLAWARLRRNPLIIVLPIAFSFCVGTGVFSHYRDHFSRTAAPERAVVGAHAGESATAYPLFVPPIYALENALPILQLGQDEKWAPNPQKGIVVYWILSILRWIMIIFGWLCGITLGFAVSERLKGF